MNKTIIFVAFCLLIQGYGQVCNGGKARIESAGTDDGNYLNIWYPDTTSLIAKTGGNDDMGLYLIVINNGVAQAPTLFKLATNGLGDPAENTRLKTFIEGLATNTYVLVGIKGGSQYVDQVGMDALKLLGANQWPTLGKERVSFAMIGKKGATNTPQMFKLPKTGISVIEGCITTGALTCAEGQYFDSAANACKACDVSCKLCSQTAKTCTACAADYQMTSASQGICSKTGGIISCPTGFIKMNNQCIAPTCIDEITNLNAVDGECSEELTPVRRYKSIIKMPGFPMKQACGYSIELTVETKDTKYLAIPFETKLDDLSAQIIFYNPFADAKANCPVVESEQSITYTCKFNATVIMAKVPQTTIWLTQTLIVDKTSAAVLKSITIVKNEMQACTGDKCTFQISVASVANQCASFVDCSSVVAKKEFKRGDTIIVRQQISEDSFKSYFLNARSVKLISPETEIALKLYTANNAKAGEIIYSIPLVVALGTVDLEVTSTVSLTKGLLRNLQTTNKENVVKTTETITMTDKTNPPPCEGSNCPCDGLCPWEKILIGVLVGVGGAIVLALIAFFVYRKMKAGKSEAKYQDAKQVELQQQH